MAKQLSFYNVQFGIEDKVPAQETFDRSVREKNLLFNFELILKEIAGENGLEIGDIVTELELAVLQAGKKQQVFAQGSISVKSIHHVKDSAGLFRQGFNKLIEAIKSDQIVIQADDPEHLFQQAECECDTVCSECEHKKDE